MTNPLPEAANSRAWPAYARVPSFVPVPVRARRDGWTELKQAEFIGWLAQTGSVSAAAARVGLSRETAYRLRDCAKHGFAAAAFAHAWDAVVAIRAGSKVPARKVTAVELKQAALDGEMQVRMRRGKFVVATRKPSDSALLRLLR